MGDWIEQFDNFLRQYQAQQPDATFVKKPKVYPYYKPKLSNEATLKRTNRFYSNYSQAKDNPLSSTQETVRNTLRWMKDNVYEGLPAGVSNCTLTASQWIDPTNPVKNASSIVNNPSKYNYISIDSASAVPGNMLIAKVPNKESYHTMIISGFAPEDGTYDFNGSPYPYKKGEPLLTYSRGGHDESFIQRDIPLSVYTANSDGHTENRYYRYNFPNEVMLPEIVVTPKKKKYFRCGYF